MKKILLAFLIVSTYFEALQSQNFAPTGTKWRYDFAAFGQVLKQAFFLQGNEIDISPLPNGLYVLQLIDNQDFSVYKKIMKQ